MRTIRDEDDDVTIEGCRCVRATERAILVELPAERGRDELWIPQSLVRDESEVFEAGNTGRLVVAGWWAAKNGLA